MRMPKSVLFLCFLAGIIGFGDHPKAEGPTAVFHVIGDIDNPNVADGAMTIVRDATRVGSGIYAVGGAVTRQTCAVLPNQGPCPNTDTPILWRFDGTNATLEALPDIDVNTAATQMQGAFDITADGAYIASQARISNAPATGFSQRPVRVETILLPSPAATLNLNTTFSPALTHQATATAISHGGAIVYGFGSPAGTPARALRFDTSGSTSLIIPFVCPAISLPGCPAADTTNFVVARGTSLNGNVAVGASFIAASGGAPPSPRKAFRYEHGSGVTPIPFLSGGSFNDALALSPDGDRVLVIGNATDSPNGEAYLYTASTNTIQRLGSPNPDLFEAWGPGGRICVNSQGACNARSSAGGMSADGSVVVMNFGSPPITGGQYAYFWNEHGWFHLTSALLAHNVDLGLSGWDPKTLFVTGISPDGTLVFGAGAQNGVVRGFVADFPAGALASFDPAPSPPANASIVGTWTQPGDPQTVVFTADGAYFHIKRMQAGTFVSAGFEHGYYTYDGTNFTVTTLFDSNGDEGLSDGNGSTFPVAVTGDTLTFVDDPEDSHLERVVGGPGSIVGGWVQGNPAQRDSSFVAVFLASGQMFQATDNPEFGGPGAEYATYTWSPAVTCAPFTHELNIFPEGGSPDLHNCGTLASNERTVHALDDDGHSEFHLARVIDPRTPLITSALDAVATVGLPFAYQIAATNSPNTFGAFGLPSWLAFDPATGRLSGTPPAVTTVALDIRIEASNALSTITGRDHLSLVVVAPAIVSTGATTVTPIAPEEPGETPPITIEFENVTNGGTISVATIDPEIVESAPEPPAGFSLGDDPVYFEIVPSEGLTFTGPVTVCFSYAGITFSGFPRLLHYDDELMTWVDITASVDTGNEIICGLTASFSPFVIAATTLNASGFHPPIKPLAGALNMAKGGSTVALKFNVFAEGNVEITNPDDIDNLKFQVSPVACEGGTAENWEVGTSTGNTGLRYDALTRQFVQNWKTPTVPGCYIVRVQGDGLLLSALFKVR